MGGSTNRSELVDNLGTIASFLHHELYASCLSLNAPQAGGLFLLHFLGVAGLQELQVEAAMKRSIAKGRRVILAEELPLD